VRQELERLNGLGDCRDISWQDMWQRFRAVYTGRGYSEAELKRIHDKWRQLSAEVCGI
jgi:hypothetical protein